MTTIVHHYYPLGSDNIGDLLVARAIAGALPRHFGPVQIVPMPVNDRYRAGDRPVGLRGENVERTNAEADLVIVGGSNLLEPRRLGKRAAGKPAWGVFTDLPSIERLAKPLLLLGMGTGSDYGRPIQPYPEQAASEVKALHGKAFAAAVRDQPTTDALARIGVSTVCTGCPVTFLTDRPVTAAEKNAPLIVSLPPNRITRWLSGRLFMRGFVNYVAWLKRRGVPFVVTLHETGDIALARDILPFDTPTFYTEDLDELIARYESSAGVVGFRLHAGLLGLGLGKPIIPVGVDWRGKAFIETFGLQHLSIEPRRLRQYAKLRRLTDMLLKGDPQLIEALADGKATFSARYESFLADAAQRFSALRPPR